MTPLKARLEKLLQRLIEIRNDLAHAIEDAEEGGIVDDSSTKEASTAVVELGGQIQTIEDQLAELDKRPNPHYYADEEYCPNCDCPNCLY